MKIQLIGLYDRGDLQKERLHFLANVDLDLSYYVIYDTRYSDAASISTGNRLCYWFAPKAVKASENIVVYTREGLASTETQSGQTYHFFFRGLSEPQYRTQELCAVIFELSSWVTTRLGIDYPPA